MKGYVAIIPVNSVYHVDPGNVINFKFCLLLVPVLTCHETCVEIREEFGELVPPSTMDSSSAFTHWAPSPDLIFI